MEIALPSKSDPHCIAYYKAIEDLDAVVSAIESRMDSMCPMIASLRASPSDNMTQEEAAVIHNCKLRIIELEPVVFGAPRDRLAIKRVLRRANANHDNMAPLCDLRFILHNLGSQSASQQSEDRPA